LHSNTQDDPITATMFQEKSRKVLDFHAPLVERRVRNRTPSPWYNENTKLAKTEQRKAEETWKKSKLTVHKEIYISLKNKYKKAILEAKRAHYNKQCLNVKDSKQFFRFTNNCLGEKRTPYLPSNVHTSKLVEQFSDYFYEKVCKIRRSLGEHESKPDDASFEGEKMMTFEEVSNGEITELITSSSNKSCELAPLPTSLLKSTLQATGPFITEVINKSLKTGTFPCLYKKALVRPLLKKPGLDTNDLKNYRTDQCQT